MKTFQITNDIKGFDYGIVHAHSADAAREAFCKEAGDDPNEIVATELPLQQLYARIRATSKYFGQTEEGTAFPVYLDPHSGKWEYVVHGNANNYRLADVELLILGADGTELLLT